MGSARSHDPLQGPRPNPLPAAPPWQSGPSAGSARPSPADLTAPRQGTPPAWPSPGTAAPPAVGTGGGLPPAYAGTAGAGAQHPAGAPAWPHGARQAPPSAQGRQAAGPNQQRAPPPNPGLHQREDDAILPPPWAWPLPPFSATLGVDEPLLPPDATCCSLIDQLGPTVVLGPLARLFSTAAAMPEGALYTTPDAAAMLEACLHLHRARGQGDLCVLGLGLSGSMSQALSQQLALLGADITVVLANLVETPTGDLDSASLTVHGCLCWGIRTMRTASELSVLGHTLRIRPARPHGHPSGPVPHHVIAIACRIRQLPLRTADAPAMSVSAGPDRPAFTSVLAMGELAQSLAYAWGMAGHSSGLSTWTTRTYHPGRMPGMATGPFG